MSNSANLNDSATSLLESGRRTLSVEASALATLADSLDDHFVRLCRTVLSCRGRIVLMGVGKSGHIAAKIAATLSSTGTPAQFIHPTEAAHGDLGAVDSRDFVIFLSKSGSSSELEALIPVLQEAGNRMACLTCRSDSSLAGLCDFCLTIPLDEEACPINLAPTTSTTLMLALGDALALALVDARGFSREDFARSHPSGSLGRQLLMRVHNLMHSGDALPLVRPSSTIADALLTVSEKGLGMAMVTEEDRPLGVLTDGDVRRCLGKNIDIHSTTIDRVMTKGFQQTEPSARAVDALKLMQQKQITVLPVVEAERLVGILTMHAIVRAGLT